MLCLVYVLRVSKPSVSSRFTTQFNKLVTTHHSFLNQTLTSVEVAKQTNVTRLLCVRTLKGRTFADAKKDMSEVVKTAQVRHVYDCKVQ